MSVAWVGAGVAAAGTVGSMVSSNKAANAQSDAAKQANQTTLATNAQSRADNAPFLYNGTAASNKLAAMLGIEPKGGGPGSTVITANDLIDTTGDAWRPNADLYANDANYRKAWDGWYAAHTAQFGGGPSTSGGGNLGAAQDQLQQWGFNLEQYNKDQQAKAQAQGQANTANDPNFGSLLKNFTLQDFQNDPVAQLGLQFGLDQGTKGINNQAAATGSLLSGATLKALTQYGNDYASTKANDSFNRFNANRDAQYNKLASLAGVGQVTAAQVGSNQLATGQSIAQNQLGVGNARAASAIGGANAITNGIGQGWNMYQGNQLMNRLGPQQSPLSSYTPQYAGQGNPGGWTNGYDL